MGKAVDTALPTATIGTALLLAHTEDACHIIISQDAVRDDFHIQYDSAVLWVPINSANASQTCVDIILIMYLLS
jgi:hypothetical protein